MENKSKPIETKTSPFALPKTTTNSLQYSNVKRLKYSPNKTNALINSFIFIFILTSTGLIVYVLVTLSQLRQVVNNTVNTIVNSDTTLIPINDTIDIPTPVVIPWERREFKINNNTVWSLLLPSNFVETQNSNGTILLEGDDNNERYKIILDFPLFTNYPGGEPLDLKSWIQSELAFLNPEDSFLVKSENLSLENNSSATLLLNYKEVTLDSGNARLLGEKKSLVLYINKSRSRNYSKISVVPQGTYSEDTARAFLYRIISSLEF